MKPQFEAPAAEEFPPNRRHRRDTRTTTQQVLDALTSRAGLTALILACTVLGIGVPIATPLCLLAGLLVFAVASLNHALWRTRLPFRLPKESGLTDHNDPKPGRRAFHRARGVVLIGNAWPDAPGVPGGDELWLSFEDLLSHLLVLGSTGSGKTELLVSVLLSAGLGTGSGGAYIDPKGEYRLAAQVFVLCRLLGRDDDFRIVNYNTGAKRHNLRTCKRLSNTTNPLSFGTAENIAQTILTLIPEPEGDNAVFVQSAQALMQAEIYAIVDLRDQGIPVSIATIREYLDPDRFAELAHDPRVKEANRNSMLAFMSGVQWREDPMWEIVKGKLRNAARLRETSLPVLSPAARGPAPGTADQSHHVLEPFYQQFGFARSYFNQLMSSLADTYGHIYGAARPEVDMPDIIMQRRVLVALLPSLEKSPAETRNIGKLNLAMLRNAVAVGLGARAMGTLRDVIYSRPSSAPKPYPIITDEYAAIATEGYELVMTQARGLGIAAAIGNQDYAGMTKTGDKGTGQASAAQIVANTNLKLAMKTNDPRDTWELFKALAAEADVTKAYRYTRPHDSAAHHSYVSDVDVRREARVDLRDLQQQIKGEFHAFMNGTVVRGYAFHADPPLEEDFQLIIHEMLQVLPPPRERLEQRHGAPKRLAERLTALIKGETTLVIDASLGETLAAPAAVFAAPGGLDRMETAVAAVGHWVITHRADVEGRRPASVESRRPVEAYDDADDDTRVAERSSAPLPQQVPLALAIDEGPDDAFAGVPHGAPALAEGFRLSADDIAQAAARSASDIVNGLAEDLTRIERALGRSSDEAAAAAQHFTEDIEGALAYPTPPTPQPDADTSDRLSRAVERLLGAATSRRTPTDR